VIFGAAIDDTLKDKVRITVIATGFGEKDPIKKIAPKTHAYTANPVFAHKAVDGGELHGQAIKNEADNNDLSTRPSVFIKDKVDNEPFKSGSMPSSKPIANEDDDLEIPAFLRRKMK
jgi:hypothetical protein